MIEILLNNGSKFRMTEISLKGKIVDSNGSESGGITAYPITESEINLLDSKMPIQSLYDTIFASHVCEDENMPSETSENA